MIRLFILILALFLFSCSNDDSTGKSKGYTYEDFSETFKNASLPFQLSDTFLIKAKDTAVLHDSLFASLLPDSLLKKVFGKTRGVKQVPLFKTATPDGGQFFIMKAVARNKVAAFLLVFDKGKAFTAAFPFLVPDSDPSTNEIAGIDKSYSIYKTVYRKQPNDVMAEGKDVYVYDAASKSLVLVMTDPLDEKSMELINPIDTLAKTHKLAGDYVKDKRNIVSIRDGRKPNMLTVFVHIEKENDCVGDIKGDALLTNPTTAIYQQAGDPCVLQLNFSGNTVRLHEIQGCGSKRGLGCAFDGSFSKKKTPKEKSAKGKNPPRKK